jgi:hypothetical protein
MLALVSVVYLRDLAAEALSRPHYSIEFRVHWSSGDSNKTAKWGLKPEL